MIYIRQCKHCNKNFVLKNIAYEKRGGGKYCSKQCSKFATKKYSFNENFFDEIDNSTKAYWLGFCMADGCNTGDELTIELSAKDKNQLLMMRKDLCADHPISYRKRNESQMASLRISSRYLCQQLDKWGCIQNKSFVLQYPSNLSKEFERDFIRGFFDGDGCIHVHKNEKSKTFSMYSVSSSFLIRIKDIIEQETEIKLHYYTQDNGHIISIMKKNDIEAIFHYLYDNATTYMNRKKEKFLRTPSSVIL